MPPPPELVGKAVADSPSDSLDAPMPALAKSMRPKGRPESSTPEKRTRRAGAPPLSAMTRSGSTGASAWYTAQDRRCPVRWRATTGAGKAGLTIVPSGAVTRMDR